MSSNGFELGNFTSNLQPPGSLKTDLFSIYNDYHEDKKVDLFNITHLPGDILRGM